MHYPSDAVNTGLSTVFTSHEIMLGVEFQLSDQVIPTMTGPIPVTQYNPFFKILINSSPSWVQQQQDPERSNLALFQTFNTPL